MNPWLNIPIEDYEAHMSMSSVAQSQYLSQSLRDTANEIQPNSVAIIGCSGGNGLDHLLSRGLKKVVGVDINPSYIFTTQERYKHRFEDLELLCQDFTSPECSFWPVDLVFAALVFEYVDYKLGLSSITRFINPGKYLSVILQLPCKTITEISPGPYTSLNALSSLFKFILPKDFEAYAKSVGLSIVTSKCITLNSGKMFHEFLFQKKDMSITLPDVT